MKKHKRERHNPIKERYMTLFFKEIGMKARDGKTVYISKEHHERINKILHVIGKNEVSLFGYIYNVLEQHFAENKEVITKLYVNNREDIF